MKRFLDRLRATARADPETVWYDVVSPADIDAAEDYLGFAIPKLLARSYLEISNGGFGPGLLIGLPGGYESSWGDLLSTWKELRGLDEFEETWLPVIDWGCCQLSLIDCDDLQMVTLYEGDFHVEDYTFETLMRRWLDGEWPALESGEFYRRKR